MKQRDACPICSNREFKLLRHYEEKNLFKCTSCKMVFDSRIPDEITLHEHYEQYGRNDYLSPITKKRYKEILRGFEKFKGSKRILDVGCGIGFFLETAKELGWEVYGTEFTDEAIKICEGKGIKMFKGSIEDIDFGELKFDVITSFELVEHLINPSSHFQTINQLLKKQGLYYLTTPNFNSLNSSALKDKWNVISFPEHLMYFTSSSITTALNNANFSIHKIQSTGISPGRLIKSRNNSSMDFSDESSTDEKLRQNIEGNAILRLMKILANKLLSVLNKGESLKIWAINH